MLIGDPEGLELCRRLREGEPGRSWDREVPVILLGHTVPPAAAMTDPTRRWGLVLLGTRYTPLHFSKPDANGGAREAGGLSNGCDASPPHGERFASGPTAPHVFVHHRAQGLVFVPYCRDELCIQQTGPSRSLAQKQGCKKDMEP